MSRNGWFSLAFLLFILPPCSDAAGFWGELGKIAVKAAEEGAEKAPGAIAKGATHGAKKELVKEVSKGSEVALIKNENNVTGVKTELNGPGSNVTVDGNSTLGTVLAWIGGIVFVFFLIGVFGKER